MTKIFLNKKTKITFFTDTFQFQILRIQSPPHQSVFLPPPNLQNSTPRINARIWVAGEFENETILSFLFLFFLKTQSLLSNNNNLSKFQQVPHILHRSLPCIASIMYWTRLRRGNMIFRPPLKQLKQNPISTDFIVYCAESYRMHRSSMEFRICVTISIAFENIWNQEWIVNCKF